MASSRTVNEFKKAAPEPTLWGSLCSPPHHQFSHNTKDVSRCSSGPRSAAININSHPSSEPQYSHSKAIPVGPADHSVSYEKPSVAYSWLRGGQSKTSAMTSSSPSQESLSSNSPDHYPTIPIETRPSATKSRTGLISPPSSKESNTFAAHPHVSRIQTRSFSTVLSGTPEDIPTGTRSNRNSYCKPETSFAPRRSNTVDGMKSLSSFRTRTNRANSAASPASLFLSRMTGLSSPQAQPNPDERGQPLLFNCQKYVIGDVIGKGGFSEVKKIHSVEENGKPTKAVKIVKKQTPNSTDLENNRVLAEVEHEINIWRFLKHKHILPLHEVQDTDFAFFCLTEYYQGGTLLDLLRKTREKRRLLSLNEGEDVANKNLPRGIKLEHARVYAHQLALALRYLHNDAGVVHRDVKLENCLIMECIKDDDSAGHISLCDFGMAQYYDDNSSVEYEDSESFDLSLTRPSLLRQNNSSYSSRNFGPAVTSTNYHSSESSSALCSERSSTSLDQSPSRSNRVNSLTSFSMRRSLSLATNATSATNDTAGTTVITGSLPYAAPELTTSQVEIFDPRIDLWSFGVCVYVMLAGKFPFSHAVESILLAKIREANIEWGLVWDALGWSSEIEGTPTSDESMGKRGIDQHTAREIMRMLKGCLEPNPDRRWSIDEVLECDWFRGLPEDY